MSTELKSAQFLSAQFQQDLQDAVAGPPEPQSTVTESSSPPAFHRPPRRQDGVVSFITWTLAIFGGFGACGGAWSLYSYATSPPELEQVQNAFAGNPELEKAFAGHPGFQMQQEILNRTIAAREKCSPVVYFNMVLRVLVGIGFIASCVCLLTYRRGACSLAALCCVAAIIYNISSVVLTYLMMPSLDGIAGMPPRAGFFAVLIGVGVTAAVSLFKSGFYLFFALYLSKPNIKAMYDEVDMVAA